MTLIKILSVDHSILLLDKPFSTLDYQTRLLVSDDVYKIIRNKGKSAMPITHDISEYMCYKVQSLVIVVWVLIIVNLILNQLVLIVIDLLKKSLLIILLINNFENLEKN